MSENTIMWYYKNTSGTCLEPLYYGIINKTAPTCSKPLYYEIIKKTAATELEPN